MFLVHLHSQASGLGPNCSTMRVDAAAFQITGSRSGDVNDTFTATFYDDIGAPCNAYTGIMAIEKATVIAQ